ncbi:HAD phosphatase [Phanerochaete sordida]|uniref:HAD phosphatase n=1 Tax=Phanerochaete sordida TaxID=48140 RepID=A0A9P3GN69_9APHY|nr:HAD phosphatase [Phanerochaete sordida]
MPFNLPGTLVPLHLIFSPRLVVPSLVVRDIRQLDFYELRKAGYRGAVFDKDNCLTAPHRDQLVPELTDAWCECREAFGEGNVLIVSNSAGTRVDPGEIQAESVTFHLKTPVLRHSVFKPSYSCISSIRKYFSSLPEPIRDDELLVVGDRIFTDIVMANRMARRRAVPAPDTARPSGAGKLSEKTHESNATAPTEPPESLRTPSPRTGPLSIWTNGVWQREAAAMRFLEKSFMEGVRRYVVADNGVEVKGGDVSKFVRPDPIPDEPPKAERVSLVKRLWSRVRRS